MKRTLIRYLQIFIFTAGSLSCTSPNLYEDLASNKESDAALFEDAQKLIDDGDYTGAINKLLATTADFQASVRVKETLAGAYAARCGMEFLTFVGNLGNGGADSLFKIAMNGFVGVSTDNYADCQAAEAVIEGMGAASVRSSSQNLFMLFLELAKLGNRVRSVADVDPVATGDGTVDATFDCMDSVPLADAKEIIDSFSKVLENLTAVGAAAVSGAESITEIATLCGAACVNLDYSGGDPDPEVADETDAPILLVRALLNSQAVGVGSCNDPDPANCICL